MEKACHFAVARRYLAWRYRLGRAVGGGTHMVFEHADRADHAADEQETPKRKEDCDDRVRYEECDKNFAPLGKQMRYVECRMDRADRLTLIDEFAAREACQPVFVDRHGLGAVPRGVFGWKFRIRLDFVWVGGSEHASVRTRDHGFDRHKGLVNGGRAVERVEHFPHVPAQDRRQYGRRKAVEICAGQTVEIAFLGAGKAIEDPLGDGRADHYHQQGDDGRDAEGQRERLPAAEWSHPNCLTVSTLAAMVSNSSGGVTTKPSRRNISSTFRPSWSSGHGDEGIAKRGYSRVSGQRFRRGDRWKSKPFRFPDDYGPGHQLRFNLAHDLPDVSVHAS